MVAAAAKPKEAVCVTGANGFMGSWLVRSLIEQGYTTIHASIYPSSDPTHLFSLSGATSPLVHLHIHEADVLDPDAILKAVEGCQGIFHVVSPCSLDDPKDRRPNSSDPPCRSRSTCSKPREKSRNQHKWYPVSKTLAEKSAWDYAEKQGIDVVAINPSTCLGPLLQPILNASCAVLLQLLQGSKDTQEYHWLGAVMLKMSLNFSLNTLSTVCGLWLLQDFHGNSLRCECQLRVNNIEHFRYTGETQPGLVSCEDAAKRLINLGLVFTPVEDAVRETVDSLVAKGFLKIQT
ncbi:hypothetical protein F3Y22_tig00110332pilonHSYRG00901 [Hibiscus syriacus]|uniref:NAD-dependent epimerase/dehydratase domain-containing protein n=1 Tax=Hibiscus syriacus TaxID=106335 RepID=A0A6A3B093_HIBSY|nr:hypothetical protein F3Y22_tig00110332pilonHSYRG00901 [Hibiscus syriacus]